MFDTQGGHATTGPNRERNARIAGAAVLGAIVVLAILASLSPGSSFVPGESGRPSPTRGAPGPGGSVLSAGDVVSVLGAAPASWDPQQIADAGSAGTLSQVYESLTALDAHNRVQPALAASWDVANGGTQVTFTLRPGLTFSDGSRITAADVRRSWLRVIDPHRPSPLAGLLTDVAGASAYMAGSGSADAVGIDANDTALIVHFRRPAAYFVSAAASPTLAVVPPSVTDIAVGAAGASLPANLVVSGAYVPLSQSDTEIQLAANPRYWAGRAPIASVNVTTDLLGASPIDTFQSDHIDYVPIFREDAAWARYDATLGPQLRRNASLSVSYYGFTTDRPPFDNVDVRRAFARAVDWGRLVTLDDPSATPATSLVPAGIEGRGTQDFSPQYDVDAAKAALARAGFPGGRGFPSVTLVSSGGTYEAAVASELKRVLGVTVNVEIMAFNEYSDRLSSDPPAFWTLDWIADYPHPQDFLGLLLESGSSSNTGHWSNADFDAAIERAAATESALAQERAYAEAQTIVQDQAPVIPLRYGDDWALSRTGLLGAEETGPGFLRYASLAWAPR